MPTLDRRAFLGALGSGTLGLGACLSSRASVDGLPVLDMQLGWLAGGNQLGEVVAKRLGYFAEEGLHAVTSARIARRAGVATGTFYLHFADKHVLFEEIAFRGSLYWTLRQRLPAWGAATVSAAVFSVLHFYGLPGFLMTFWSGLVWALVFEHVRSLWPGIAAHALYNALYVASVMALYR